MILAALHGKLPSRQAESEDVLTSNVFSFFKYSDRTRYLRALLQLHGLEATETELREAEFIFWPRYDDYTEPDFVLMVGRYYVLFEAKHLSGFGEQTPERKCQIEREIEGGIEESLSLGKEFVYVTITSHYNRPAKLLDHISFNGGERIRWMNWQAVASLLLASLESGEDLPNREFVEDLYNLLAKMKLRSFLPFSRFTADIPPPPTMLFFSARSARYRGAFIGFRSALEVDAPIQGPSPHLFFQRQYFSSLSGNDIHLFDYTLGGNK